MRSLPTAARDRWSGLLGVSTHVCQMFTIIPYGRSVLLRSGKSEPDLLASVVPDEQLCPSAETPFVQLSFEEIPTEDVEQVLELSQPKASGRKDKRIFGLRYTDQRV